MLAGRQVGRREILGQVQVLDYDGVCEREREGDSDGPRMLPQLWGCGLRWSGSIGNKKTDARGQNRALDPAIDGGGLVEVGAEVNGSKRSHVRTGQWVG